MPPSAHRGIIKSEGIGDIDIRTHRILRHSGLRATATGSGTTPRWLDGAVPDHSNEERPDGVQQYARSAAMRKDSMSGHFSEMLLSFLLLVSLGFLLFASKVHNDQLALWGQNMALQLLAALLTLMTAGGIKSATSNKPPDVPKADEEKKI